MIKILERSNLIENQREGEEKYQNEIENLREIVKN